MPRKPAPAIIVAVSLAVIVLLVALLRGSQPGHTGSGEATMVGDAGKAIPAASDGTSPEPRADDARLEAPEAGSRTVKGRVIDENERPISSASVSFVTYGTPSIVVGTGSSGEFEAEIGDSLPLLVSATAEGFVTASLQLRTHESEIEIVMRRGRRVSGTVMRGSEPVPGATVAAGAARTTSGAGGVFVIDDLPPGPISLQATRGEARSMPARVDLTHWPVHGLVLRLEDPGGIQVRVLTMDGSPVPGATVVVTPHAWEGRHEAHTNDEGVVLFDSLPPGSAHVIASAPGLASADTNAEIPSGGRGNLLLRLTEAHAVVVHTEMDRGAPSRGETVTLRLVPADGDLTQLSSMHQQTAGIGEPAVFENVAEGSWRAVAHHPMYASDPVPVDVPGSDVTIVLEHGGKVAGRVLDEDGAPVAGAFVIASPLVERGATRADLRPARRGRSDSEGVFEIDGIGPGEWRLVPRLPGFTAAEPVAARRGDTHLVLRMDRARAIRGQVVDGRGVPLASIRVIARAVEGERRRVARAASDADGHFSIDNLVPGRYEVHAERSQRHSERMTVSAGEEGLRLTIPVGSTVQGRVTGPDGAPPPRYTVLGFSFSDQLGAFEIPDLDPRETTIWIEAPGLLRRDVSVVLQDDRATDLGTIVLDAPASLEGVVVDDRGEPMPNVTIVLEVLEEGGAHPSIAATDEEGLFSFSGLRLGRARLQAIIDGDIGGSKEAALESGRATNVRFVVSSE